MPSAFVLLLGSIGLAPVAAMLGSPLLEGLLLVALATAVGLAAFALPAGEAAHFRGALQPAFAVALVPAVLLCLQIAPLPFLTHPVWTSAGEALGRSFLASVSLDIGATSLVLARYVGIVAAILASAACAVDRRRAQVLLVALTIAAAWSAMLGALAAWAPDVFVAAREPGVAADSVDGACFGVVLALACFYLAVERHEIHAADRKRFPWRVCMRLALCVVAFLVCLQVVWWLAGAALLWIAALQGGVFGAIVLARRLELRPWGIGTVAATLLVIAAALVFRNSDTAGAGDPTLMFADAPRFAVAMAQRIMADGSWTGNGAGSFPSLVSLYRQVDDPVTAATLPTTAAAVAIGMGRPMVWAGLVTALWLFATFVRGALRRGRDSVFASAAAAGTAGFALAGLVNAGTLGLGSTMIAAGLCGLGLVQVEGRANASSLH